MSANIKLTLSVLAGATSLEFFVEDANSHQNVITPVTVNVNAQTQVIQQLTGIPPGSVIAVVEAFNGTTLIGSGQSQAVTVSAGSNTQVSVTVIAIATVNGKLYVCDAIQNLVNRFDNAITGTTALGATITGNKTTLSTPGGLFLDQTNDKLYVANAGGHDVLVFNNVSTLAGTTNVAPNQTISFTAIQLRGIAVDVGRNVLYVSDGAANVVDVFDNASTLNNTVVPSRVITGLNQPNGLFVDAAGDRLFIPQSNASVLQLNNAHTQTGAVVVAQTLSGNQTGLTTPVSVAIDDLNNLVVTDAGNGGHEFSYQTATTFGNGGNTAHKVDVTGANTTQNNPAQNFLDIGSKKLFVANSGGGSVLVFNNFSSLTATQNIAPSQTITGMTVPTGLAVDPTR